MLGKQLTFITIVQTDMSTSTWYIGYLNYSVLMHNDNHSVADCIIASVRYRGAKVRGLGEGRNPPPP